MRLRSPRLEALLGAPLDQVTEPALLGLITGAVSEDADLDYKAKLYERTERGNSDLASDVAAMANTRGGLIIIGIQENARSQAGLATPVALRGDDVARIQQILADRVAPLPDTDVLLVPSAGDPALGWILIGTAPAAGAPLAVRAGGALRYSRRVGPTTKHLTEPEVAAAYRDREQRARRRDERASTLQQAAETRLDRQVGVWLAVTAVPELAGDQPIEASTLQRATAELQGADIGSVFPQGATLFRVRVGKGRIWADGELRESHQSRFAHYEFHADGSSYLAVRIPSQSDIDAASGVHTEAITDATIPRLLVNALHRAARHAVRAAASGNLLLDARLLVPPDTDQFNLTQANQYFPDTRSSTLGVPEDLDASWAAPLDALTRPTGTLPAAAAALADQLAQALGIAELGYLRRDGTIVETAWDDQDRAKLQPFEAAATGSAGAT